MNDIDITIGKVLPVWWAMIWRAMLGSVVAAFVLGVFIGLTMAAAGYPRMGGVAAALAGYLVSVPISVWALMLALKKNYSEFQIVFMKIPPYLGGTQEGKRVKSG